MKRNGVPKRVLSCIAALVLVVSCFLTTYAGAPVSYTGDSGDGKSEVIIASTGGKVTYELGTVSGLTWGSDMQYTAVGTHGRLMAIDSDDGVFLFWEDIYAKRIISYDPIYEFTVSSKMNVRAQFASVSESKHFVAFVNYGGTVLQRGPYAIGESVSAPNLTALPGFTFTGWSQKVNTIPSDERDLILYPKYRIDDETYTVTLTNDAYVSGAGTYSNYQTVRLSADPKNGSGQSFSYWKDADGTIVSYDRSYCFRINYDVTLTAVYGETVTPVPVVRITTVCHDSGNMKITFFAERSVPDTYTVVQHGILMSVGQSTTADDLVLSRATQSGSVRKAIGASNESCGTFSLAKTKVNSTTYVSARPFVVCKNTAGSLVVVYGDVVCTSNGAAN